jgi:hypothetical protein
MRGLVVMAALAKRLKIAINVLASLCPGSDVINDLHLDQPALVSAIGIFTPWMGCGICITLRLPRRTIATCS